MRQRYNKIEIITKAIHTNIQQAQAHTLHGTRATPHHTRFKTAFELPTTWKLIFMYFDHNNFRFLMMPREKKGRERVSDEIRNKQKREQFI